jgi:hypothetical protein
MGVPHGAGAALPGHLVGRKFVQAQASPLAADAPSVRRSESGMNLNEAGPALERQLRVAGLDPDRLDPRQAWKVFKAYARQPAGCDADILYVQLGMRDPVDELIHVTFIRHLEISDAEGELEPVREIVCDLGYDPEPEAPAAEVELSSAAFASLEDFFAAVEARSDFQHAMATEPSGSVVSWSEL